MNRNHSAVGLLIFWKNHIEQPIAKHHKIFSVTVVSSFANFTVKC